MSAGTSGPSGWLSFAISLGALGISAWSAWWNRRRADIAETNNLIAGSAPWAGLVQKAVEKVVGTAGKYRDALVQVCRVPAATSAAKMQQIADVRAHLDTLRRDVYELQLLAPKAYVVEEARSQFDFIDDRAFFFDTATLAMSADEVTHVTSQLSHAFGNFMDVVRTFAFKRTNFI